MERTDKKSKKKLLIVLKNRSKKLRPRTNDKTEKRELEYIQKGGANYNVVLHSNYAFPTAPNDVNAKLTNLDLKASGPPIHPFALDNIDDFFAKCTKFLTSDEFDTLYLKSKFVITDPTDRSTKTINTSADTLLNFQSLILLEMCISITSEINNGNDLDKFKKNTTAAPPDDLFVNLDDAIQGIKELSDNLKCLIAVFTYNFFYNKTQDKDEKKKISNKIDEKGVPYCLHILNYLVNEFKSENIKLVETDAFLKKDDNVTYSVILIEKNKFVSLQGADDAALKRNFETKLTFLASHADKVDSINKKFKYEYNLEDVKKIIKEVVFDEADA
jgi:hypothetical protein